MTKLYPIGTRLITQEEWKAYLLKKIFRSNDDCQGKWSIIVTDQNQKWLSPMPIKDDILQVHDPFYPRGHGTAVKCKSDEYLVLPGDENEEDPDNWKIQVDSEAIAIWADYVERIISRVYPNGERLPFIEFEQLEKNND